MKSSIFTVTTEIFEGPIELLLRLIEQKKLTINEISLASVTDEYISHMRSSGELKLHSVTQFIVVATTLVLIKSRTLLPALVLTPEEEGSIDDLERRLKLYKFFQELGIKINENFMKTPILGRPYVASMAVFSPDKKMTQDGMLVSLENVLALVPQKEKLPEVSVQKVIHIEEMMDRLIERVQAGLQLSFKNFMASSGGAPKNKEEQKEVKQYMVVGFLAMLEMVRNGIIEVLQNNVYEDILIEKK